MTQIQPFLHPLPPDANPPQPLPLPYYTAHLYGKEEPELKHFLNVLKRRALVIVGVALATTAGAAAWTWTRTPIYESTFRVLVEPITGSNKSQQLLQEASQGQLSDFDYATQVEVLLSPGLLEPTVKRLQKTYPDINHGVLVGNLQVTRLRNTKILAVSYRDPDKKKAEFVSRQVAIGYLRYSFQQRQINLKQGMKFVDEQLPKLRQRVNQLQTDLQRFRQANGIIDPESRGGQLTERLNAIQQQRDQAQTQLSEAQSLYGALQQQLGLQPRQALSASSLSESQRYQKLLNQVQEVEGQIAIESVRFKAGSPTLKALQAKRDNLLPLLQQEAQRILRDRQPAGLNDGNLTQTSLDLSKQLLNAANQLFVLQVRTQSLADAERRLRQDFSVVPALAFQYTDLQRELKVATESLNRFLATRENLELEASQKALPWQLISPPSMPEVPISPKVPFNLAIGVITGLILGIAGALLIEKLDNVFHSPTDLKDITRLPLLGIVPFQRKVRDLIASTPLGELPPGQSDASLNEADAELQFDPSFESALSRSGYTASPFLEAFRSLHTNIRLLGSDSPVQSLVIGSAVPSEGKSTVAVHLAKAAATMGQRVLLVDADLRRPQVNTYLGIPNMRGLSNVISTNLRVEEVIQQAPQDENLFVLTSGQIPPDPTKLLSSQKMHTLMEHLKAEFDLVIYDTPPVLGLADSSILATHTDGLVLVVGLGKTDRTTLMMALDGLRVSSTTLLGVVANGVKGYTTSSYDYYRRYYGHDRQEATVDG